MSCKKFYYTFKQNLLSLLLILPLLVGADQLSAQINKNAKFASVGNDKVAFCGVRYDFPKKGQSTWYYRVKSGKSPKIKHTTFEVGDRFKSSYIAAMGEWDRKNPNKMRRYNLKDKRSCYYGKDNSLGKHAFKGIGFKRSFKKNQEKCYFITVKGNFEKEKIKMAAKSKKKYEPKKDQGYVYGPSKKCKKKGDKGDKDDKDDDDKGDNGDKDLPECKEYKFTAFSSKGHDVWLNGFPFPKSCGFSSSQKSYKFKYEKGGHFKIHKDGSATLMGIVKSVDKSNVKFKVVLRLRRVHTYEEWAKKGRGIKVPSKYKNIADANKKDWLFWELNEKHSYLYGVSGPIKGWRVGMSHRPSDKSKGFQFGVAANDKNKEFGFSGWFEWRVRKYGKTFKGSGDFNSNVECKTKDKEPKVERVCVFTEHSPNGHDFAIYGIPCVGNSDFLFENGGGTFTLYKDGTAKLTGRVANKGDNSIKFDIDLRLKERQDWATWSSVDGRTYLYNSVAKGQAILNHQLWDYFLLDEEKTKVTGVAGCVDGIELKLKPSSERYAFQLGDGANDKSLGYGFSGWFDWTAEIDGVTKTGNGDFNNQASCPPGKKIERECVFTEHSENGHDFAIYKLPCVGNSDFVFVDGGTFVQYKDGTARLYGNLYNRGDNSITMYTELWLKDGKTWEEWSAQGGSYKFNSKTEAQARANHQDWMYFILDEKKSKTIGTGGCIEGWEISLTHAPDDLQYAFQMGLGSNDKSEGYGFSGWFDWKAKKDGVSYEGNGDYNHQVDCPPASNSRKASKNAEATDASPVLNPELKAGTNSQELHATRFAAREFRVYPNPSQGVLNLDLPVEKSGAYQVQILDIMGRALKVQSYNFAEGTNSISLDISELSNGAYMLQVQGADGANGKWFMKN